MTSISSFALLGCCLLLGVGSGAQRATFVPANDVSFVISAKHSRYKAGEPILLKYVVTNVSGSPLYVPRDWEAKCPANPHVWAWFEDSSGQHYVPGYGGSCSPSANPKSVTERMSKEAILLKPRETFTGTFRFERNLFGGLKPGRYRIEASLSGWAEDKFTEAEQSQLARLPYPFLSGDVPASTSIELCP